MNQEKVDNILKYPLNWLMHKVLIKINSSSTAATRIILSICILTIFTSCGRFNLLTYKNKKYYTENSIITKHATFELYQHVCYNRPNMIDDEFCYYLKLNFVDTSAAKAKKIINIQTDTSIIHVKYGIVSIWNWEDENNQLSGKIEILKWDKDEVILQENIKVVDFRRKETKKFVGKRTYLRKNGW